MKKLKQSLQRAADLAMCGAVVAANLEGVRTPWVKVFTKNIGEAKQNRTATTKAVYATFVALILLSTVTATSSTANTFLTPGAQYDFVS